LSDILAMQQFTALYDAYNRQVYGYAVTCADRQSADEIVGDTFLVAWRRFDEMPDPPLPWLLGVARNLARDRVRASARRSATEVELDSWIPTDEQTAADPADVVTDRASLRAALAGLDAGDRELLTLVAWHGLTPAEAARVIGCSRTAYSVRLHRARRRLEQAMKDQTETKDHPETPLNSVIPPVTPLRKDVTR
jgi:RNA polymerase sigma-70 factor (ECF subfamily)